MGRRWCSRENNNIKLDSEQVLFWDDDEKIYLFQFDIASHPRRKEIEFVWNNIKEYEKQHGKNKQWSVYHKELIGLHGYSFDEPDDREIIGMVKSGKYDKSGNTTYESILGDCFLLTRVNAKKKYMILTDKEMYDYFYGRCKPILQDIDLIYLDVDEHRYLLDD